MKHRRKKMQKMKGKKREIEEKEKQIDRMNERKNTKYQEHRNILSEKIKETN